MTQVLLSMRSLHRRPVGLNTSECELSSQPDNHARLSFLGCLFHVGSIRSCLCLFQIRSLWQFAQTSSLFSNSSIIFRFDLSKNDDIGFPFPPTRSIWQGCKFSPQSVQGFCFNLSKRIRVSNRLLLVCCFLWSSYLPITYSSSIGRI